MLALRRSQLISSIVALLGGAWLLATPEAAAAANNCPENQIVQGCGPNDIPIELLQGCDACNRALYCTYSEAQQAFIAGCEHDS